MFSYFIIIILLAFSALFSGLTLGLMGLNKSELKRKMSLGDKDAGRVYIVRKQGNLLLTTLLIGNVAINSALSIFLGSITSGIVAGVTATGLIVIFGEIIPQAVFSRFAIILGSKMYIIVRIFIFVLYPISWPIAWILNKTLGDELSTIYSRQELMKIIEEHEDAGESDIDADEERIIKGALTFSEKLVKDVMTPRTVVKMFESSQVISDSFLDLMRESSYSRIPIFRNTQDQIVGILYLKQLLGEKNKGKTVEEIVEKKVVFVDETEKLDIVFNNFLRSRQHLFVVKNEFGGVVGVITLEDILEEIIKSEIMDEADKYQDLRKLARENNK